MTRTARVCMSQLPREIVKLIIDLFACDIHRYICWALHADFNKLN